MITMSDPGSWPDNLQKSAKMQQNHVLECDERKIFRVSDGLDLVDEFSLMLLAFDRVIRKSKKRYPTLRKRKLFYLMELWAIQRKNGWFTRNDMALIMGYNDKLYRIENYWSKLIRENWMMQIDHSVPRKSNEPSTRPKAVVTSFFLTVLSALTLGLGEYLRDEGEKAFKPLNLWFDGGLLRAIRNDCGMSVKTVADRLGLAVRTVMQFETGFIPISKQNSEKLIELFYFKIHPRYWTPEVKAKVKSGELDWPHFEYLKETNWFPSRTTYTEFNRVDQPRIVKAQERRKAEQESKDATIQAIKEQVNGNYDRNSFFEE